MKRLLVLPSWIIVRITLPFLSKGHPWKGKRFTLRDWSKGSTKLNDQYSLMMWVGLIYVIIALIIIF